MVKVIVAKTKNDCEHLLGQFVDESNYDLLVEEDTDCYMPPDMTSTSETEERRIAFKFRKNFFTYFRANLFIINQFNQLC